MEAVGCWGVETHAPATLRRVESNTQRSHVHPVRAGAAANPVCSHDPAQAPTEAPEDVQTPQNLRGPVHVCQE